MGMHVLHRCDNPSCVNPKHLWLGTQADNNRDRDAKGRGCLDRFGEKNGRCVVSNAVVKKIRQLYAKGAMTQQAIADKYGCSQTQVSRIILSQQRT